MNTHDSFDALMIRLEGGDHEAAARVFDHFGRRLIALARTTLGERLHAREDPEDVVQSVFRSFFTRFQKGQFLVENWNCLWGVLTRITLRKCGHRLEYHGAAQRDLAREKGSFTYPDDFQALSREPTPLEAATLSDTLAALLVDLEDRDVAIVTRHLQGYGEKEIAEEVGRSLRTVRRTLARARKRLLRLVENNDP